MSKLACTLAFVAPVALGVGIGAAFAFQEVSGDTYRRAAGAWPELSEQEREDVAEAMADGNLTRWEWNGVGNHLEGRAWMKFYNHRGDASESTEQQPARDALAHLITTNPIR